MPGLWHDGRMVSVMRIVVGLVTDAVRFVFLLSHSASAIRAENLVLRKQLAQYVERGIKPRRVDFVTRVGLALLTKLFDWRDAEVIVRPATVIRWHRAGWRLFWRCNSRLGRPPISAELRALIRRMASENPVWGEERIANELLIKLGIRVSSRTVSKYMPKRPEGKPRGDQRWSTFLRNHAKAVIACDFFVAVTATFRLVYVFVVIHHHSRRLVHFNVTEHPTAAWTLQQLRESVGDGDCFRYLLHDRDSIFAKSLDKSIGALGMTVLKSPPHSREGECHLRARDRYDTARVPRLDDPHFRSASAVNPEGVGEPLQCWAPAHVVVPRRARSTSWLQRSFDPFRPISFGRTARCQCSIYTKRAPSRIFPDGGPRLIQLSWSTPLPKRYE